MPHPDEADAAALCKAATFVRLGNGGRARFWSDNWLPSKRSILDTYHILATFVCDSGISVVDALRNRRWVRDVQGGVSTAAISQYLHLWDFLHTVQLQPGEEDRLIWRHSKDGNFSTSSAYKLFFAANIKFPCAGPIWKSKAPARCKFFMWLAVHQRCLTADNLQKRGWPHSDVCQLCLSAPESCTHLFVHCPFSSRTWQLIRAWTNADFPVPGQAFASTEDWWLQVRKRVPKNLRRDFDSVVILLHWKLWKERNNRIFEHVSHYEEIVFEGIREDIALWRSAGRVLAI